MKIGFGMHDLSMDERRIDALLSSESGPVAKHVKGLGRQVSIIAKSLAGVRTGRLKKSISVSRDRSYGPGYAVLVGSDVRHALVHHMGARRHMILPRRPGGVLRFRRGSTVVYTRSVRHPGHAPNPYLTTALRRVVG
jgi:hypothetical protein